MPKGNYEDKAEGATSGQITHGHAQPGSEIEEASIASGIPPASLDVYYDDSDREKHRHEHGG